MTNNPRNIIENTNFKKVEVRKPKKEPKAYPVKAIKTFADTKYLYLYKILKHGKVRIKSLQYSIKLKPLL